MKTMSYTDSRARFAEVLPVVIISLAEFESLRGIAYLMRSPPVVITMAAKSPRSRCSINENIV